MDNQTTAARPPALYAKAILVSICTLYFFSYLQRVAVPGTIFDQLQSAFRASAGTITTLSVLYFYVYGGLQLIAGTITDRFGVPKVLVVGGLCLVVGAFIFPSAHSIAALYFSRILLATGASMIYACIVKSLDTLFAPALFPVLLGVSISLGYSGGLVGTLPFAALVDKWGWRTVLMGVSVLTLVAYTVAATMIIRTRKLFMQSSRIQGLISIGTVLANRESRPVMLIGAINFSVYYIFQATIGKKLLHDIYNLSSTASALFPFVMMLITIICLSSSGFISRVIGDRRKPIVVFASSAMLAGAVLLILCIACRWSYGWVMLSYTLLALTSLGSVMTGTLMKEINPPETVGTAIGLSNGFCYIAMALFTTTGGWILDRYAWKAVEVNGTLAYPREAYVTIGIFGALLLVISLWLSCRIKDPKSIALVRR